MEVVYISYLYAIPCPSLKCLKEELYTPVLHFQSNPYHLVLNTTAILENCGPLTESRIMPIKLLFYCSVLSIYNTLSLREMSAMGTVYSCASLLSRQFLYTCTENNCNFEGLLQFD